MTTTINAELATKTNQLDRLNPTPPDDTDLKSLGRVAKAAAKKGAETAWELGFACNKAKALCEKRKAKFGDWCSEWIPEVNDRTRQRYQRVGKLTLAEA